MRLNINSPAYFTQNYGVDDDIYNLCKQIRLFLNDKDYSEVVDTIGITPLVVPQKILDEGKWRQIIQYDLKYKIVIVKKHIDFEEYLNASIEERKLLIFQNILDSVKSIHKKSKLDYKRYEADLVEFVRKNNLVRFE